MRSEKCLGTVWWRAAAAFGTLLACASRDLTSIDASATDAPSPAPTPAACAVRANGGNDDNDGSSDGEGAIGSARAGLSVVDRSIVGGPSDYVADASLRSREPDLMRSQRARRAAAWQIAARVVAPVGLRADVPAPTPALRAWQTWHNKDDLTRIFRRLYADLAPDERARRAPFSPTAIDAAWTWNDGAIADFDEWTVERLAAYRSALDGAEQVAGVGGIARVAHSPSVSRHWLESYTEVLDCRRTDGASGAAAADASAALADAGSTVASGCGPQQTVETFQPACLAGQFAPAAALVKASWTRLGAGAPLYAFDTSAASLQRKLSAEGGFDWGPGDREVSPNASQMYTLELPNGNRFGLTGLHIMTKELEHWFWLTLWWSDEPDTDFGADRPLGLPAPFDHYKLCSVVWFDEDDPEPGAGFDVDAPSLAEALASTRPEPGAPTWCSNPYIERGPGNAATNCIGCHQHAGTPLSTEDVLAASDPASGSGRRQSRTTFPADYVFALRRGDDIGAMFVETEDHYAPSPRSP